MEWSEAWQMKFNVNKCKVMHYGFNNPSYEYLMNDEVLIDTEKERDLGVTIHDRRGPPPDSSQGTAPKAYLSGP